jgi:hypothetical protein
MYSILGVQEALRSLLNFGRRDVFVGFLIAKEAAVAALCHTQAIPGRHFQ